MEVDNYTRLCSIIDTYLDMNQIVLGLIRDGKVEDLKYLVEALDMDLDLEDIKEAIRCGHLDVVEYILSVIDTHDIDYEALVGLAKAHRHTHIVAYIRSMIPIIEMDNRVDAILQEEAERRAKDIGKHTPVYTHEAPPQCLEVLKQKEDKLSLGGGVDKKKDSSCSVM